MELYACLIGSSERKYFFMHNLSTRTDDITLVYPFWVIVNEGAAPILVDTGFSHDAATRHGVNGYRDPSESLAKLGIKPADIKLVVVSHLHYDHFGVPERFPNAEFAMQVEDIDYFTKRGVGHPACGLADAKSLEQLAQLRKDGRVQELKGDAKLAAGVRTILVGGHTAGSQITVVEGGGKRVVLACDASHFYDNLETRTPTSVIHSYEAYENGFLTIEREAAAAPGGTWFPGHDPKMLERMSAVHDGIYRAM